MCADRIGREIVQDCLPANALHIDGVSLFGFELFNDGGFVAIGHKLDADLAIIAEGIGEFGGGIDGRICTPEIKAKTAVFGFHTRRKRATDPQINGRMGCMLVRRGGIPLHDVCRGGPAGPDMIYWGGNGGLDGDNRRSSHFFLDTTIKRCYYTIAASFMRGLVKPSFPPRLPYF